MKMWRNVEKMWRDMKKMLSARDKINKYNDIWCEEKSKLYKQLRDKRKQKINWIKNKYYAVDKIPEVYQNVYVGDQQQLAEQFKTQPQCYGGTTLSENESELLKMHPKYSIFDKIDEVDCEAEIEKSLTKLRWQKGKEKRTVNSENNALDLTPYDIERKEFDFRKSRSTDLPFNINTYMPKPLEIKEEVKLQCLKNELIKITSDYAKSKNISGVNLNEVQRAGLKSLKKRQKMNEIVIFQTDKTGKMIVDSPENYSEGAKPHFENDEIIRYHEYSKIEETINAHTIFWVRILQAAKDTGDMKRFKSSMLTHNSEVSTLYTYRKDHKEYEDQIKGPPVRPLCDVSDSYGHKLSYLLCNILKEVSDEESTICDSSEDMIAAIREVNESGSVQENSVIGSMDVKALYPSLQLDFTIDIVCQEFYNSNVKIKGIDYQELGLYLSLNKPYEYLKREGISDYCPERKNKRSAPPKLSASGININKDVRFRAWNDRKRIPDEKFERVMLKESLKIAVSVIMKNHTYQFNDVIRKQKEGGAIGIDLTGVIAQIFMSWWDKELLKKLGEKSIVPFLYKRYVDDINIGVKSLSHNDGYLIGEKMQLNSDSDETLPNDKETFDIIRDMGNEIHESIKLTNDVPSNHRDGKVPILDLKCWIGIVRNEQGLNTYNILHEYYMKEVSSKMVIHRLAAISLNSKRKILTQECLRIILNTSSELGWVVIAEKLTFFMSRMQFAGYDHQFRLEVLKSAIEAHRRMVEKEMQNIRRIHRRREWQKTSRKKDRLEQKKNWFRTGGYDTVLFIPPTPNSELMKEMQQEIKKSGIKMKAVEKSGSKLIKIIQRNDPFRKNNCRDAKECFVCLGKHPRSCRETGVSYKITCLSQNCEFQYTGKTGLNAYTRGKKHEEEYRAKREGSMLWKHCTNIHGGVNQNFDMEVIDRVRGDPTKRQILESVRMQRVPAEYTMNSRSEWTSARLPRINVSANP